MNIAVNTRLLIPGKMEGIGWYTYEIMKRMVLNHPEHHFFFLFDRNFDQEFIFADNVEGIILPPQARHPILYKWWFHRSVPKALRSVNADVFFSPEGYLPLKSEVPSVNVIHDLGFEHFPEHLPKRDLKFYRKYFPEYAQKANKVITVSEFSKEDIVKTYGIDPSKVEVIYNGVRENLKMKKKPSMERYFIYVGSLHPRKNIERMIKAFDAFVSRTEVGFKLKIVGRKMGKSELIDAAQNQLNKKNQIEFLGYQSDEQLKVLLSQAEAMVYVPLFEGFGLPVLEAFQNEIPLICSNNTSIPEVAGDAALLVNPQNQKEIENAMLKMSADPKLRKELIEKGKEQVKKFSWDKASETTWKIIEACLD